MSTDVITEPSTESDVVAERDDAAAEALVQEELLVEEVSIDGMCGVY